MYLKRKTLHSWQGNKMSELNVMALALILRAVCICACVTGVVIMAQNDKSGWGWLIFLAFCVSQTSYKYSHENC
jgi:hypothetical protein